MYIAQREDFAVEVTHEQFGELVALLGLGYDGLLRPYALDVVVAVELVHEGVIGVLALAVTVGEHPLEVAVGEEVAELLQAYLLLVVEVGAAVALSCGTIGWVEEEEGVAAGFIVGLLVVAIGDGDLLQQFAIGIDGALIADDGIQQMVVGAVELAVAVDAVVGIGSLVEEDE